MSSAVGQQADGPFQGTPQAPDFLFMEKYIVTKSLIALAFALTLPAGLALAEPQNVIPPAQQEAMQPAQQSQSVETQSFDAYRANINGNTAVPTTGVYDQGDEFIGPRGFPLEGWQQINNPNS
jgi:hypothetical protein